MNNVKNEVSGEILEYVKSELDRGSDNIFKQFADSVSDSVVGDGELIVERLNGDDNE